MRHYLSPYRKDSVWDFMSEVEKAFEDVWSQPTGYVGVARSASPTASFTPAVDLHETDDFYLISVDLPGVEQKNIKVDVQNSRLTISGERARENKSEDGNFKRFERSYGRFERSFQLPQEVNSDKIEARFENGVLEVIVAKVETAKPRSIEIGSGAKTGLFSRLLGQKTVEPKGDSH